MEKHHAPYMTAYESTRPETVMKETGWIREELLPEDPSLTGFNSPVWKKPYRKNIGIE